MKNTLLDMGLRLMLVCAIAAVGLGLTYTVVEGRIAEIEQQEREEAGAEVLASLEAEPREDLELLASLRGTYEDLEGVFEGVDGDGNTIGYAFVVESKGYSRMTVAVGVDLDCKVVGIEVVKDEETPSIGGKAINDGGFLGQFLEKGPQKLTLGVDIDAYSGATLTSRGITSAVNLALDICAELDKPEG
jgi:electron transport complex protein RnfG